MDDSIAETDGSERESTDPYETMVNAADDGLFILDVAADSGEVRFSRTNDTYRQLVGHEDTELHGKTPREALGPLGTTVSERGLEAVEEGDPVEYEQRFATSDQSVRWETTLKPVLEGGGVVQLVGTAREQDEPDPLGAGLDVSTEQLELVLEASKLGIYDWNVVEDEITFGDRVPELFEADPAEFDGSLSEWHDRVHPADYARMEADLEGFLAGDRDFAKDEYRVRSSDGEWTWVQSFNKVVERGADGRATRVVGVLQDITERKQRQQELQRLKERLELAVGGANLGVWDWDLQTDVVQFNDNWATMLGYDPDDISPTLEEWEQRVHPEDIDRVNAVLERHLDDETEYYDTEHRMRTASGEWKWIQDIGRVVERDADGEPLRAVGIHLDIDERKQSEEALENAREGLRQIIDLVPDFIFVKNSRGEYLIANEATAEAFGVEPGEVGGHEEDEVLPDSDQGEEFRGDDREVLETGEPKEIQEELVTADGDTRLLQTTKMPYEVPGSGEEAILGYARDVTELKRYEQTLERQRDNLEVLNKVVRHDVRNDLQLVQVYSELLEDHVEEGGQEYVQQVREAAQDAVKITETARDVTEVLLQSGTNRSPVQLRYVIEEQIDEIRSSYEGALVTLDGTVPEVEVLADEMLESVFRNLLNNAVIHNDKELPEVEVSVDVGEAVQVRVADNGPGIPDDRKGEIFDEGETGVDSNSTGLGLFLVHTLVERYEGTVWIEDNEPEGSVFVVELPVAE
ncbi:PAS domain-containing protein [Halovenus halobia]|uniref:PAS domain-containing protein n=1 Tax=Halovenus halobia TaxID=3396622 RepID=UPI003F55810A